MSNNDNATKQKHGLVIETPFKCTTPVQIRYTDFDMQGHVNNSIYLNFFDVAKMDYFKRVRGSEYNWEKVNVVMGNITIDFLSPTEYVDDVAVETQCIHIGNKSLQLVHRLVNVHTHEVKCQCQCLLVHLDSKTLQPARVPDVWRQAIHDFEGRDLSK